MRAINSEVMKLSNQRMVLNSIRRNAVSRAALAEETQLTRAAISQIVDELMAEGLMAETTLVSNSRPGRKQTLLAIQQDALWIGGIDIGRMRYHLGVVDLGGHTLCTQSGPVAGRNPEEVLDEVAARLKSAIAQLPNPRRIYGVGLSMPGPLDCTEGVVQNPPYFRAWHNLPVVKILKEKLGREVYLANISNAHALDEFYFGVGTTGVRDFMVLRVNEGVGAGFILDGRLFNGVRGHLPEIGHITVERDGPLCDCGNRGCLEKYIAIPAILEGTPFDSWNQVMDNMDTDPEAAALFERVAGDLGFEIVNIINVFDLEKVVLSGGFVYGGERLAAAVNRWIEGKSLRMLDRNTVLAGPPIQHARIAAMPAYHTIFCP